MFVQEKTKTITRNQLTLFEYVQTYSSLVKMIEQGSKIPVEPCETLEATVNKMILERKTNILIERKVGYVHNLVEIMDV